MIQTCKFRNSKLNLISIFTAIILIMIADINCYSNTRNNQSGNTNDNDTIAQVLLIHNSLYPSYQDATKHIKEYLDHYGIIYNETDIANENNPNYNEYHLLLFAHDSIFINISSEKQAFYKEQIHNALNDSIGIVSFSDILNEGTTYRKKVYFRNAVIEDTTHFTTQLHKKGEIINFKNYIQGQFSQNSSYTPLISSDNNCSLVSSTRITNGFFTFWTTYRWMKDIYLGPLRGLDDCFVRSLIWSAKKPFFVRGILPVVTMRVDDTYGSGEIWKQSPLYWVQMANKYHFKPWMGIFTETMKNNTIDNLRDLIFEGNCTASPHAFTYTKFLFFDHTNKTPFDYLRTSENISLIEKWYHNNAPLPKSTFLLPHYYEIGSNFVDYVINNWGIKYIGFLQQPDFGYDSGTSRLNLKPYIYDKLNVLPRTNTSFAFADYVFSGNNKIFNGLTEIREWGYDWLDNTEVNKAVERGVNIISRSLQSGNIAMLMTHEVDHIDRVSPENWELIMQRLTESIVKYKPLYLTVDSALNILESTCNSKIKSIKKENGEFRIKFTGNTFAPTSLFIYTQKDDNVEQEMVVLPKFTDEYVYDYVSDSGRKTKYNYYKKITGGASESSDTSDPNSLINDPFLYNSELPLSQFPVQTNTLTGSSNLFITKANDKDNWWQAEIEIPHEYFLEGIDIWGRVDIPMNQDKGSQNIIIKIENDIQSWVSKPIDNLKFFNYMYNYKRINFRTEGAPEKLLETAKRLRIGHVEGNKDELALAEIRPVINSIDNYNQNPEPSNVKGTFMIYPNPVTGESFMVDIHGDNENYEFAVFDLSGQIVFKKNVSSSFLLKSEIFKNQGFYLAKLKSYDNEMVVKFVVVKQ